MARLPTIPLRHHTRLDPVEDSDSLVATGVGPDGAALAIWASERGREALDAVTVSPGWATFPDARTSEPVGVRISTHAPDRVALVRLNDLRVAHPFVQPLPEGRVLLVGARCNWRADGPDENGVIVDSEGEIVHSATVGDGIEHVLTSPSGAVWIGYFDEGVFGNYGWGSPGPEPLGSSGIVRMTRDLEVDWNYPHDSAFGAIADCYALNVDGESAWSYYYTDFPIVRIDDGAISGWTSAVGGARALVVQENDVALVGGYGAERHRVVAGSLGEDEFEQHATLRLTLDDGSALPPEATFTGRGSELHVLVGAEWYKLYVADIKRATRRPSGRQWSSA